MEYARGKEKKSRKREKIIDKEAPSDSSMEGERDKAAFPIRQSWRIQKGKCRTKGIVRGDSPEKWTDAERKEGKKGVLMCEETFVRKIFIQLRPMEPIRRA